MALGTLGSTLNDELNRLANGGTYRDMNQMVDEALAAKQWANRENIIPYSTDTVGILNEIAGLGLDKKNWLDFNGVCNYIAGTTGLPAAAALRQVYPTTDLLTSQASYYVDATAPTNWGSLGFVRLNGLTGNFMLAQNTAPMRITGDIDLRYRVAMDNWVPGTDAVFISRWGGTQSDLYFGINATGNLQFWWNDNAGNRFVGSTVATGITNGAVKWVRATMDVDNGASGNTVTFFTSDDGTNWTQLGSPVISAGVTSIRTGTDQFGIGSNSGGGTLSAQNVYNAQILNGINGTVVFNMNVATNYSSSRLDSFTATTGQTVSVFGVSANTITNLGAAGSLLPTTVGSSTAADSNDPKFLDHTGTNYVYLSGVAGNNMTVPDAAALDITGDIDVRAYLAADDWSPAAAQDLVAKWQASPNLSWRFRVLSTGRLTFVWVTDGTTGTVQFKDSTVSIPFADGQAGWVRATLDVDNGSSQNEVKFFTSTDGVNWTQLGTTITSAGVTSIFSGTSQVEIGTSSSAGNFSGKVFRAQIFNGIDGTKVLDVDTSTITTGADAYIVPVTYTGQAGAFFTGTGLSLPGTTGNYATSPDSSALDVTGDIDLRCQVALTDWTPTTTNVLISKWNSTGNQRSYQMTVAPTGVLQLLWTTDGSGTTINTINSTVAPTITDGGTLWVRAVLDVNNGASGNTVTFFTSTDGSTWTQLGTPVVTAGVTSIFSGTAALEVGTAIGGTSNPATGTFYRAQVLSGIDGWPVFDATFVGVPADSLRFTESSTNKATVSLVTTRYCTINRSTSGRKTVAVTQPTWLFGTDDYMEVNNRYMSYTASHLYLPGIAGNYARTPDAAPLDITGDIDIRAKISLDDWTPAALSTVIAKWGSGGAQSYMLQVAANGTLRFLWTTTGTYSASLDKYSTVATGITDGTTKWVRATLDVDNGASGNDLKFWTSDNGTTWTQLGSTITTAGVTSIFSGTATLDIGAIYTNTELLRGDFYRAQILNGIDGTVVFDANFEASITSLNQTSFTESSTNAATVTINRSGSTYRSAGITAAGYLYPGATNTFSASATNFLDFGSGDSFTFLAISRYWNAMATNRVLIAKTPSTGGPAWALRKLTNELRNIISVSDGTNSTGMLASPALPAGTLESASGVMNRSTQTASIYVNNNTVAVANTSAIGSPSNIHPVRIGAYADGAFFTDMEFVAAAVFRSALTAAQIRQISNYFANREVYL